MGYSIAFLGDLSFGQKDSAAWLAAPLDPSAWTDWPEGWTPQVTKGTVAELLDRLQPDLGKVERGQSGLKIRFLVSKDSQTYAGERTSLLCAFRQAAAFGGTGLLAIVGWDDAPELGVQVAVAADGTTTCRDFDGEDVALIVAGDAYAELASEVVRTLEAETKNANNPFETWRTNDWKAEEEKALARKRAVASAMAAAPTVREALDLLRPEAIEVRDSDGSYAQFRTSPMMEALVSHPGADAEQALTSELKQRTLGPIAGVEAWNASFAPGELPMAYAALWALHRRGLAEEAVATVWMAHPNERLRDLRAVLGLGRRDLDEQLAAKFGSDIDESVTAEAWLVFHGSEAPALATKLLQADPRADEVTLNRIYSLTSVLEEKQAKLRTPAWEQWLRDVDTSHPWGSDEYTAYDAYDQARKMAIELMAIWKMPEALPALLLDIERFGLTQACSALIKLGDPAAVPGLLLALGRARRKPDRTLLQATIDRLGGAPPGSPAPKAAAKVKAKPKAAAKKKSTR